ncbi:hypothetical protein E2C01_056530 [Portunus trituberculatus]|uniref:Uncharacterized protein n=1 Tax=Portunus trituberculatus TaxID=210409 RepID=A0A5B7GYG2_PORTR|nr:hypothetical protein [Portunus trituberculatus]
MQRKLDMHPMAPLPYSAPTQLLQGKLTPNLTSSYIDSPQKSSPLPKEEYSPTRRSTPPLNSPMPQLKPSDTPSPASSAG